MSNPPGFGEEPFARVKMALLKAELMPLLKKRLVIEEVVIDGLSLSLVRDASGKTNWSDLIVTDQNPVENQSAGQSETSKKKGCRNSLRKRIKNNCRSGG